MRCRTVALVLAGALAASGCSPTSRDDTTPGTIGTDDGEATLVTVVSTVPTASELPSAIAADVVDEVTGVLGIALDASHTDCIVERIPDEVDEAALLRLGLGGDLTIQPPEVQAALFGAFDACVDARELGRVAAPLLTAAGAQLPVAQCVFREIRDRLGFAGMYAYFAGNAAIGVTNAQLGDRVQDAYDACDLDVSTLTGPVGTVPPSSTTTSAPVVGTATTLLVPSTTVAPPVAPPEDPIVTTTASTTTSGPPTSVGSDSPTT